MIAFIAVGILAVLAAGVGVFVIAKRLGGDAVAKDPKVLPPVAAPPTEPIPARRSLHSALPASCSLLTPATIQAIYPGAAGDEVATSDRNLEGLRQFSRDCRWQFVTGDYIRFPMVQASGMSGDKDAEQTITFAYRNKVARLGPNVVMPRVDGKRQVPHLGSEATLIYGSGGEACRMARVLVRSRNVQFETAYGGCDRKPGQLLPTTPIAEETAINGALMMARDVLRQINSA
ncbi:hypothetical protein [Kribbella shirazensis]|uniref:DUF3558 domain-containing protein n=1 Tax=Kribbella shirazensis TaxID=1105143 RepID=A0A7X5VJ90_9ACTN|nr:hypothetical protein [Kribbella shirazensis]NIK61402.1 hypothetical protein [Kribbella shirazensis]